jgi:hypothetical protein
MVRLFVDALWDGGMAPPDECCVVLLEGREGDLSIEVDAPFHADPAPEAPLGRLDGLWNFEVVELFLVGSGERYLEIEMGPHGHYLALLLHGRRKVVEADIAISYHAHVTGPRWRGRGRIAARWLPPGIHAANAFAMHGAGDERRYLAHSPVPGMQPDFHRLEHYAPFTLPPGVSLGAGARRG